MTELKIVAVVVAKAEYQKELEKVFHDVVDGTHTEEGNISYELHQDIKNPLKYTFIEVWKSQAAIDSHNESAHFKAFVSGIEGKIDSLAVDVMKKIY